jgi:RNA polymerase sigma-70 factor (ECF subfamily)
MGPNMARHDPDTEVLIERARGGDGSARQQLLVRHRDRLRQMVAVRLDRRLAARLDPSDVVQEALADAAQNLSDYLRQPPLPFYCWLRQFAWERLVKAHQRHLHARKRAVGREERRDLPLPDESALELARRLVAPGTSPSHHLLREELRNRVQAALARLEEPDREVLVLRYLEQLSMGEIGALLRVKEGTVRLRHLRALRRLRALLGDDLEEGQP